MSDFQSGLSADQAHARLRESLQSLQRAEKNAVLWFDEIRRRRLYRRLGYSTIHAYATEKLGFSKARCSQFIRLTEALEKLPLLRDSVAKGHVAWTKARELTKVASPSNERDWVAEAKRSSRRELEAKVKASRERALSERRSDPAQASLLDSVGAAEGGTAGAAGSNVVKHVEKGSTATAPDLTCEAPVNVSLRFTPEQFARYEALVEQLHKKNSGRMQRDLPASRLPSGREELMLAGLSALLDVITEPQTVKQNVFPRGNTAARWVSAEASGVLTERFPRGNSGHGMGKKLIGTEDVSHAPSGDITGKGTDAVHEIPVPGPPFQIIVHRCEDCSRASVVSGRGNLALSKATLDRVECDSRTLNPGERNKASIPPGLRRRVLARDGHRCRAPGCGSTRFLEVHHVQFRAAGGDNRSGNLVTLCASCHQLLHEMEGAGGGNVPNIFPLANSGGR